MRSNPVLLQGVPGSPYTRKMLALLRYRRIAYELLPTAGAVPGLPPAKPPLLPTFYLPDASGQLAAVTDSTPLIRRFEQTHSERSAIPNTPAWAFIDALLEDFADEWLTKAMFHYRWHFAPDIDKAGRVLATWREPEADPARFAATAQMIATRQIERLRYVGSNPQTAPIIEAGYMRVLACMEEHLRYHRFMMGARPGASDFALYGQLTQLVQFDPTPMALADRLAPRVCGWVGVVEDLSGIAVTPQDWLSGPSMPDSLKALLCEVGRLYAPLLVANAQALEQGQKEFTTTIDGLAWTQQVFSYQAKCWMWLRRDHEALPSDQRAVVDGWLEGTGCEVLFTPPKSLPT